MRNENDYRHAGNPGSLSDKKEIKIAYLLLVHHCFDQFKRCFRAIYDKQNYYLIHIDKKASVELHEKVHLFLKQYQNASLLKSQNVVWGGFSMVDAELNGMKKLLNLYPDWDFFINLSGQDFPLRSQSYIKDFLSKNLQNNFLRVKEQSIYRNDTLNRIENYFTESLQDIEDSGTKRPFLKDTIPYIGGQWMILTRECCQFVTNMESEKINTIKKFYRNTLIPDESFFQTVLMNSSFKGEIVDDDKRLIYWIPMGDIKLRPKTLTFDDLSFIKGTDNLFARKFDMTVDSSILEILESDLLKDKSDFMSNVNINLCTKRITQISTPTKQNLNSSN